MAVARDERYRRPEVYRFTKIEGAYTGMTGNTSFVAEWDHARNQLRQEILVDDLRWRVDFPGYCIEMQDWKDLFSCMKTFDVLKLQTRALLHVGAMRVLTFLTFEDNILHVQTSGIKAWAGHMSLRTRNHLPYLLVQRQDKGEGLYYLTPLARALSKLASSPPLSDVHLLPTDGDPKQLIRLFRLVFNDQLKQAGGEFEDVGCGTVLGNDHEQVPLPVFVRQDELDAMALGGADASTHGMHMDYVWHWVEGVREWWEWERERQWKE